MKRSIKPVLACLAALLLVPVQAQAAQALAGFPKKVAGLVTSPLALGRQPDGTVRLYFAIVDELWCLQSSGRACEGYPVVLGEKTSAVGAPAVGDADGDGAEELAIALSDGRVVLLRADGTPLAGFEWKSKTGLQAGVSLIDLDGDRRAELLVGEKDGRLHALGADGRERAGFPLRSGGAITSPASSALLGSSSVRALVWGNEDGKVYAIDLAGEPLPGFPVSTGYLVSGQPSLGDIDGDGFNDVAIASQDFKIYASRHDGSLLRGFPALAGARMLAGPALADLDHDGQLDLVAAAIDGQVHALNARGQPLKGFPVKLGERVVGAPLVADLDRDGEEEVVAATGDGRLHALKSNGRPFPGFPAKLEGLPDSGPVAFELEGAVVVAIAAGEKISAFKVRRAGKSEEPLSWPEAAHDSARSGRRHPNPPTFTELAIEPEDPTCESELAAHWRFFDLDGDPEPAVQVRWFSDGKHVPELDGKRTLPKGIAHKKQRWKFELSASGAVTRTSPESVILNSRPGTAQIAFDPNPPSRETGVKVRIAQDAPDADGDKVKYSFAWLRQGRPEKGLDKPELSGKSLTKGDRWTVVVVASDGETQGPVASLDVTVADGVPSALQVALEPAAPKRGDKVKAIVKRQASDPDGDALKYRFRFSIDGVAQPFASTLDELPAFAAREKQTILVEAWADDGTLSGPIAQAQAVVVNTPPSAPVPAIAPSVARHGDRLVAGLAEPARDVDRDELTYRFSFSKDGRKLSPPDQASGVRKGETYQLEAVASDGEAESPAGRVSITVKNTPPTTPRIAFESLQLRRADPAKVKIVEPSADPDGDKVSYAFAWTRHGETQPRYTGAEVPAGELRKGERWIVTVTPSDGEEQGVPARLEAKVADSAPSSPEIALAPESPRAADEIRAVVRRDATDLDGDTLTYRYRFLIDGTPVASEESVAALPKHAAAKKRVVRVEVTAHDGELLGPVAAAEVTVGNTAPEAPQALLIPAHPTRGDRLVAGLARLAADGDGDRLSYRFAFSRNGKRIEASAGGREVSELRKGETYELSVVASDGDADSPAATARVTVGNSKPTAPVIAFERLPLRRADPVKVKVVAPAADADGDKVELAWSWRRNGELQPGLTSPELPAGTVRKGERWEVSVVPSDGEEKGEPARLEALVADSAPTAPEVVLQPESPRTGDEIRAVIRKEASDTDGDRLRYSYRFLVDGTPLNFGDSVSALPPGTVAKKRTLTVEVRADDGTELGPVASAAVVVVNTPPQAPKALLLPGKPHRGDSLEGALEAPATDADGDALTHRFAFFKAGKRVEASADGREVTDLRADEEYELVVVASDGESESEPSRVSVKVLNTPPTAPAVSFSLQAPKSGELVEVRIDRPSIDVDGNPIAYEHTFTVDGKPAGLPQGSRAVPAGRSKKHETWLVQVVPADGRENGPAGTARLVVANTAPTAAKVAIEPSEPTAETGAKARIVEPATDHDGDSISYRYSWYVDGVKIDLPPTATGLEPGSIRRGQRVELLVVPFDGEAEGTSSSAATTVRNSAPSAPTVAIEPAEPVFTDELHCVVKEQARDPDGESPRLRIVWKRDGKPVPMGFEQARVPARVARHGEEWRCEVSASDGELSSPLAQAEVKVGNSVPGAAAAVVEPESPRAGDDLRCRLSAPAPDADDDALVYEFRWKQAGMPFEAADAKEPWRLPAASVHKGSDYACEVVPSDPEGRGPPSGAKGSLGNSPPGAAKVQLMPQAPRADEKLVCKIAEQAVDPDGDEVTYRFMWWKNGTQQSFAQSTAEIPPRLLKPDDVWRCAVLAADAEAEGPLTTSDEAAVGPAASASR